LCVQDEDIRQAREIRRMDRDRHRELREQVSIDNTYAKCFNSIAS